MSNKYAEELKKEQELIANSNPFNTNNNNKPINKKNVRSVPFVDDKGESGGYFGLMLGSDHQDLEKEIRGLSTFKEIDENGKERYITKRRPNHYLSAEGGEDLIFEIKSHLSKDIKLGIMTVDEFKMQMDIIRKYFHSYLNNNLYKLGMDTEIKQRKATGLFTAIMARIRAVYSRSIAGVENARSRGALNINGEIETQSSDKFNMENYKN